MNEYEKLLESFRNHYFLKYGIRLDDELLYLFIRINELQVDLKKEIRSIPKVAFRTGWDYFFYGLGKWAGPGAAAVIVALLFFLLKK